LEDFPQLEIKIINLFESHSDIVFIFDSLDIMSFYHSNESIFKFVHSMTKILRKNSAAGYYLFGSNSLAPQLSQFFDYAAEIGQ
jgi:GTP cyclohydrolase III